jgi:hypothetical protein
MEPGVEANPDQSGLVKGKVRFQIRQAVMEEEAHPIPFLQIEGEQGIGQFVDSTIQILIGDRLASDDEGSTVWEIMGTSRDEIAGIHIQNSPYEDGIGSS